jgi:hypothetical protein
MKLTLANATPRLYIALTNLRLKVPLHRQILPPIHILNHQPLLVGQMQQTDEPVRSGDVC